MADPKRFIEVRVAVVDREGRPQDLSHAMAELAIMPKEGAGLVQAMQLMSPVPGASGAAEPEGLPPARLDDGGSVRVTVLQPSRPFEAPGGTTAYFKADVEAPPGGGEIPAKLVLTLPQGKKTVDLRIPAGGK